MIGDCVFFFKQKTAYEMRISDWSSDVCSSDLKQIGEPLGLGEIDPSIIERAPRKFARDRSPQPRHRRKRRLDRRDHGPAAMQVQFGEILTGRGRRTGKPQDQRVIERRAIGIFRSEEHTSELQSLMRNSYAVFCLKKKKNNNKQRSTQHDIK